MQKYYCKYIEPLEVEYRCAVIYTHISTIDLIEQQDNSSRNSTIHNVLPLLFHPSSR